LAVKDFIVVVIWPVCQVYFCEFFCSPSPLPQFLLPLIPLVCKSASPPSCLVLSPLIPFHFSLRLNLMVDPALTNWQDCLAAKNDPSYIDYLSSVVIECFLFFPFSRLATKVSPSFDGRPRDLCCPPFQRKTLSLASLPPQTCV